MDKVWGEGIVSHGKDDLMSSKELKQFIVESITPYILKDLQVDETAIIKNNTQAPIEYLVKTPDGIVGVEFIVDVAPNKSAVLYNEICAKELHELGHRYAVARVGIGSADSLRFERRIMLKNDGFHFDYQGLKFFNYMDHSEIRYSLSENVSWKQIYNREEQVANPYIIQKPVANYMCIFNSETYDDEINKLLNIYKIPQMHQKSLAKYIQNIGYSIAYKLTIKDTLVNFLNCVDYCKGIFLSDSVAVEKSGIIKTVIELLETNVLIELDKHSIFCFAYYVYYYILEGPFNSEKLTPEASNKLRIALFERKPEIFGYTGISEKIEKNRKINSNENLAKMQDDIQKFANDIYIKFLKVNKEINESGVAKAVDFKYVIDIMTEQLNECQTLLRFLEKGFEPKELKKKLDIFNKYKEALNNFILLLELELIIDKKLYSKSQGGRYGFFEFKKDSKLRNEQCSRVVKLMEDLKNNFQIKVFPRETELMIKNCKILFIEFKEKYKICREKENGYTELKNELCSFYDYFLTMPFTEESKEFRKGVLLVITDFIELIEFRENNVDETTIDEAEGDLFDNLKIISDKIYEIIV